MANPNTNTANQQTAESKQGAEEQNDTESDDDEVVETSPCGRWEKHKKQVWEQFFQKCIFVRNIC